MATQRSIAFLLFMSVVASANAQENGQVRMQMPVGRYEMANEATRVSAPFELIDNLIVLDVTLNGKKRALILDSGMPMEGALLFGSSKVDSIGLGFSGKIPVGGVGGAAVLSDLSTGATLQIPGLTMTNQVIIVVPRDQARSLAFEGRDGIIGFSFFANFVVEIDYENRVLTLTRPGAFHPSGTGHMIPIEVRGNRIFLQGRAEMENGSRVSLELVVDTGNRAALMLNVGYRRELVPPSEVIAYDARGLSKKLVRQAGRIRSFTIGDYTLPRVLSSLNDGTDGAAPPWEKDGNLGNEILRRFHVTFDVPNKRLFLSPNTMFSDPFEFNMAGIQFERAENGAFVVTRVIPGSPSDKAGIQTGDRLAEINDRPASRWKKDELERSMREVGAVVTLKIERGQRFIEVTLTLMRLI